MIVATLLAPGAEEFHKQLNDASLVLVLSDVSNRKAN